MQDLFQNYVSDLNKLKDAFHNELTATAEELSKAMGNYAHRSEAALKMLWRKFRLVAWGSKALAAARSISFAVFRQTAVCRTSMTDRSRIPQQMPIERESQPLQSGRSRTVCMSRAMRIASPSRSAR